MDPDENLAQQRRSAARLMEAIENQRTIDLDDVLALSELVIALDNWIAGGGFLPAAWQKGR